MKTTYILGIVLYIIGLILGLFIAGSNIMADVEAVFYGFDDLSQGRFSTLRCPPFLTRNEVGTIRATLSNPLDRPIEPVVRTDLSSPALGQSSREQISLEPGQSQTLKWQVGQANIDLGSYIFAKVYIYPVYPLPLREATCGIFVINLPFLTGSEWLILAIILGIACLGGGLFLLARENRPLTGRPRERIYALLALAIFLVTAIVCGILGWWVPGGIFFLVCILLMAVMLYLLI
jgi:hypothetical protein